MEGDVILSIDDVDMRWRDHSHVADVLAKKKDSTFTIKLMKVTKVQNETVRICSKTKFNT